MNNNIEIKAITILESYRKVLLENIIDLKHEDLQNAINQLKDLEHYSHYTCGLWCTDRPDLLEDKKHFWQINFWENKHLSITHKAKTYSFEKHNKYHVEFLRVMESPLRIIGVLNNNGSELLFEWNAKGKVLKGSRGLAPSSAYNLIPAQEDNIVSNYKSRTCENCENCESQFGEMFCQLDELSYVNDEGEEVFMQVLKDFGCNKWEKKI